MKENFVDAFETWFESRIKDIHTCLPAKIESYEEDTRKAKIKIQVKLRMKKTDPLDIPPIANVPVHFLSTQKFKFIYPLEKGDSGIVLFSEEGIGSWLKSTDVVDADSFAKFALTDAIFIPGVWSFSNVPSDETVIIEVDKDYNLNIKGKKDINITTEKNVSITSEENITVEGKEISADADKINLNSGTKGVARLDDKTLSDASVDTAFWAMWTAFFAIVTGPPIPEPGLGAPSAFQTALAAAIAGAGGTPSQLESKIDESSDSVKAGD